MTAPMIRLKSVKPICIGCDHLMAVQHQEASGPCWGYVSCVRDPDRSITSIIYCSHFAENKEKKAMMEKFLSEL